MERMIHGKYLYQGEDLTEILKMRSEIFGKGADERDPDAVHILVTLMDSPDDAGIPVGCGRLNLDLEHFRFIVDDLGILEPYRKKGYGEFALRALADKVNQCGAEKIYIEGEKLLTEDAKRFFRRMFFDDTASEETGLLSASIDAFHTCCH